MTDTTAIVTVIQDGTTPIFAVAMAVLSVLALGIVFCLCRKLFGQLGTPPPVTTGASSGKPPRRSIC